MSDKRPARRYPRIAIKRAVLVKSVAGEKEAIAPTKSLALGGCCFVTDESLGVGSDVDLLMSLGADPVPARGRVVYEMPSADGRTEVGVEFISLAPGAGETIARLMMQPPES